MHAAPNKLVATTNDLHTLPQLHHGRLERGQRPDVDSLLQPGCTS